MYLQVLTIRSEFEMSRLSPPLRLHEPQYAGSALWAHSLAVLVKSSFDCLVHIQYVLSEREFEESKEAYAGKCGYLFCFSGMCVTHGVMYIYFLYK